MQVQAFSGPTTDDVPVRDRQLNKFSFSSLVQLASGSNEPGEGGRSKISGSVRQCNFHWWPRPSGATARFWAAGVWNSRILVPLRFRVVKLTKALKPEKSAQKRVQVSAQASDIRIFALTASAVSASS